MSDAHPVPKTRTVDETDGSISMPVISAANSTIMSGTNILIYGLLKVPVFIDLPELPTYYSAR